MCWGCEEASERQALALGDLMVCWGQEQVNSKQNGDATAEEVRRRVSGGQPQSRAREASRESNLAVGPEDEGERWWGG